MIRFLFPLLFFFAGISVLSAQPFSSSLSPSSRAVLLSEVKTIAPGAKMTFAFKLEHPEGWHSYYKNSGGIEQPPSFKWSLPEGFSAGPTQWPAPEAKDSSFGTRFVYSGSPVFLTEITAPATLSPGESFTFTLDASWQICSESLCQDEKKTLSITLPVASSAEADPANAALFAKAREIQPQPADHWKISAQSDASSILLSLEPSTPLPCSPANFIPDQPFAKAASDGGKITCDNGIWMIHLQRATKDTFDHDIPQGSTLSGILIGSHSVRVPEISIAAAPPQAAPMPKFFSILGGLFLGGLILNLMPCVFPVIGLKIMGFVKQAGSHRSHIALHGIIYTLGVFFSFAVLCGVLFAIRSRLSWGYQLQEPWIVLGLVLLMFVLGLNMFGLFEVGTSATGLGGSLQTKKGYAGSFFSGMLTTIVATPCSAPLLGTAIPAAIGLPAVKFFCAFGAMAAGVSLPYLLLSFFPKLVNFLPHPGPWMESFKEGMSFLLFGTAGYFLWVYAGLIGLEHLLFPLLGLAAIAVGAWIYGRWCLPHFKHRTRLTAVILALIFAGGGIFMAKPPAPSLVTWEPWSEEKVESLLSQDKPVYIDFTAQWCATCQFNKLRAYTKPVVALMRQKGVITLKADKTKPNPEIEAALKKFGRAAIPVNVLLVPGKDPVIFNSLLSPDELISALEKL